MRAWKSKRYQQAKASFQEVLKLLKQEQANTKVRSRAWHALTLGRGSILRKLGQIAWQRKKRRRACLYYQRITTLQKGLPPNWRRWSNPFLQREVLSAAKDLRGPCQQVNASLHITTKPPGAMLSIRQNKRWQKLPTKRITTTRKSITLRLRAKGFFPLITTQRIPRWRTSTLTFTLKPKPKIPPRQPPRRVVKPPPRRIVKPPPTRRIKPPPPPFYKTWWFWTITGVAAAGATTAVVLAVTAQPEHVLKGSRNNQPHKLW